MRAKSNKTKLYTLYKKLHWKFDKNKTATKYVSVKLNLSLALCEIMIIVCLKLNKEINKIECSSIPIKSGVVVIKGS